MSDKRPNMIEFLPRDRVAALCMGRDLPLQAQGSVMFSDLTGFVRMSSALASAYGSREGAERIAEELNSLFELLIAPVHANGGNVVAFAGDAITCFFADDDGLHAVNAALAMRRSLAARPALEVRQEHFVSRIKSVIACGEVQRIDIGDPTIQRIDLMVGATVNRVSQGAQLLRGDDLLVAAEIVAAHSDHLQLIPDAEVQAAGFGRVLDWKGEAPSLPVTASVAESPKAEQVAPWLPGFLRSRLNGSTPETNAELRPVTAMFIQIDGLHLGSDLDSALRFHKFVCQVQRQLKLNQAWIIQVTSGEKGEFLYAVFGAPTADGHETERAAHCALELLKLAADTNWDCQLRIGMSHGQGWVGAYGSGQRKTYGVQGRHVNRAARLMQAASVGQVLMDQAMAEQLRKTFSLRPIGRLEIKGEPVPCNTFAIDGEFTRRLRQQNLISNGTMVGRQNEQMLLIDQLRRLLSGKSSTVLVFEGEPGIGKSRLLSFALALGSQAGLKTACAAAESQHAGAPYLVSRQILLQLAGLTAYDAERMRAWLQSQLTKLPELADSLPLLNELFPLGLPDSGALRALGPAGRRDGLSQLIVALIAAECRNGLLLVVEDAHWLDKASWGLLRHLLSADLPLAVVISARPVGENVAVEYAQICAGPGAVFRKLQPLNPSDVEKLCCQLLDVAQIPDAVLQLIYDYAQGNPYFCEELALALRDRGAIKVHDRIAELAVSPQRLAALDLPLTVEGVVHSRIDELDEATQLTLKVASIIGRNFSFELLMDVHPLQLDAERLHRQMNQLAQLDITPIAENEPKLCYFFRHAVTQQAAYARWTREQKVPIHQAVAKWIECHCKAEEQQQYWLPLARHWRNAGDLPRCMQYLQRAAAQAVNSGAFDTSARLFRELIDLNAIHRCVGDPLEIARWREKCSDAYYALGRLDLALVEAEAVVGALERPLPSKPGPIAFALARQGLALLLHLVLPRAWWADRPEHAPRNLLLARCYYRISEISFFTGAPGRIPLSDFAQINAAERAAPSSLELARAYTNATIIAQILRLPDMRRLYELGLRRVRSKLGAEATRDTEYYNRRALLLLGDGKMAEAYRLARLAVANANGAGDTLRLLRTLPLARSIALIWGDYKLADEVSHELEVAAKPLMKAQPDGDIGVMLRNQRAISALLMGQHEKVAPLLQRLQIDLDGSAVTTQRKIWIRTAMIMKCLADQEHTRARELAVDLLHWLPWRRPVAAPLLEPYAIVSEVALQAWEAGETSMKDDLLLKRGLRLLGAYAQTYPVGRPRWLLQQGRVLILKGQPARARRKLHRAFKTAEGMNLRPDLGQILLALANCCPPSSSDRDLYAARARTQFAEIGSGAWLTQAEHALNDCVE